MGRRTGILCLPAAHRRRASKKVPGVAAWTLAIPPLQTQRVSVTHAVDYPKDDLVSNLP